MASLAGLTSPGGAGPEVEISYNGFAFVGPYVESTLSAQPVYDSTNRVVKHVLYSLTVKGVITNDAEDGVASGSDPSDLSETAAVRIQSSAGSDPATVRDRLLMAGGALVYKGQGVGQVTVNTGDEDRDVDWGPKPRRCDLRKLGGSLVYEVVWTCEFCLPECRGVKQGLGQIRSFVYEVEYMANDGGYVTRTLSGMIEISLNRAGPNFEGGVPGRVIAPLGVSNVDQWLDVIRSEIPEGFRRNGVRRSISADKTVLTFSITDQEIESANPFPTGVRSIDMDHTISFGRSRHAFTQVSHTISGNCEAVSGYSPLYAWSRALLIIQKRISEVKRSGHFWPMLIDFTLTERIFGKSIGFSLSWVCNPVVAGADAAAGNRVAMTAVRNNISNSGLFSGVDTDWVAWRTSVAEAQSLRGARRLTHDAVASETLHSLCSAYSFGAGSVIRDTIMAAANSTVTSSALGADCPPIAAAVLEFKNTIEVKYATGAEQVFTLGEYGTDSPIASGPTPDPVKPQDAVTSGMPQTGPQNKVVAIKSGGAQWTARMVGYSYTVCHDPPIPQIAEVYVDGTKMSLRYVESSGVVTRQERVGVLGDGLPIHRKDWEFQLIMDTPSGGTTAKLPAGSQIPGSGTTSANSAAAGGVAGSVAPNKLTSKIVDF